MMKTNVSRRVQVAIAFLSACVRQKVSPFRYFYVHLHHSTNDTAIYSKQTINENIPSQWKLPSILLLHEQSVGSWIGEITKTFSFPLFLKPEWGENSLGVYRVTNTPDLITTCKKIKKTKQNYICQQAGKGLYEYDFFFIKGEENASPALFECTQMHFATGTDHKGSPSPSFINGINHGTIYTNETKHLSRKQQTAIWEHLKQLGDFQFARVGLLANTLSEVEKGYFEVIEINIFTPMPLNALEEGLSSSEQKKLLSTYMNTLIKSVRMKKNIPSYAFWKMLKIIWRKNRMLLHHK